MPNPRRVERVAEQIKREIGQMLLSGLKVDRGGTGMVSVTAVDLSGDLQHAKVFVSVFGSDEVRKETMAGLQLATGRVRSEIGQRVRLRRTPEIIFVEDRSLERGTNIISLLNEISSQRSDAEEIDAIETPAEV
jgi:ribosome-binding factor A